MGLLDFLFGLPEEEPKKKKKDYSFGNDTWDKKYPDAFDNDFGPDYEDNGFNKFDDNDGY